jgi:hypothetical protein
VSPRVSWLVGYIAGVAATTALVLALSWLTGCDETVELVWGGEHGTVYVCETPCAPGRNEWCWNGSESELERLLGDRCDEADIGDDRLWPAVVGCAYGPRGSGCNATCGCFHEEP